MRAKLVAIPYLLFGLSILAAGPSRAVTILIDPGPVGTTYGSQDFAFSELNGTIASGQTLSLDFLFPAGVDAVYHFNGSGTPSLYVGPPTSSSPALSVSRRW
jgi:hypothetical protein